MSITVVSAFNDEFSDILTIAIIGAATQLGVKVIQKICHGFGEDEQLHLVLVPHSDQFVFDVSDENINCLLTSIEFSSGNIEIIVSQQLKNIQQAKLIIVCDDFEKKMTIKSAKSAAEYISFYGKSDALIAVETSQTDVFTNIFRRHVDRSQQVISLKFSLLAKLFQKSLSKILHEPFRGIIQEDDIQLFLAGFCDNAFLVLGEASLISEGSLGMNLREKNITNEMMHDAYKLAMGTFYQLENRLNFDVVSLEADIIAHFCKSYTAGGSFMGYANIILRKNEAEHYGLFAESELNILVSFYNGSFKYVLPEILQDEKKQLFALKKRADKIIEPIAKKLNDNAILNRYGLFFYRGTSLRSQEESSAYGPCAKNKTNFSCES